MSNDNKAPDKFPRKMVGPDGKVITVYGVTTRAVVVAKEPDWDFWRLRKFVKDWEAAALSIGIDPDSMKHHPQAWMAGAPRAIFIRSSFTNKEQEGMFDKRYRLAEEWGKTNGDRVRYFNSGEIELAPFGRWATAKRLSVPAEFAEMVTGNIEQLATGEDAGPATNIAPVKVGAGDTGNGQEESPAQRRAALDITTKRGCPRLILECWDEVERLHGSNADGRQVQRILKRHLEKNDEGPTLKTIQNQLRNLRVKKLIP